MRRRKLSMRPLASSNFSSEGILLLTLTSRRCAQKPFSIVSACTGTFLSFAYGDFARLRMPWSRQGGFFVSATCECGANSRVPLFGAARAAKTARPGCQEEIVAAETTEETNCLREKLCFLLMVYFLLAAAQSSLPRANHNETVSGQVPCCGPVGSPPHGRTYMY